MNTSLFCLKYFPFLADTCFKTVPWPRRAARHPSNLSEL